MILQENKRDVVIGGNFKTTGFGIATSAKMFHLFSKNIYTYDVRAVIREISCNALDAHVDAGVDKPFSVHLPTMFEPWFSVRDYGKGLDDEDIRQIYCIYGASTKEHRNDQIGALGLGSKSPFAIVESFMVTSNHDGVKRTYSCFLNEKGEPNIAQLTEEETDETGIEVYVPIEGRADQFRQEAVFVYQYFDKQPTLNIKGIEEEIAARQNRYMTVTPDFAVSPASEGSMVAVMGNVAYAIPPFSETDPETGEEVDYDIELDGYYRFELGQLDFDPGREVLMLNATTKAAVKAKAQLVQSTLRATLIQQIEAEGTPYKQYLMKEELSSGALAMYIGSRKELDKYNLPDCEEPYTVYSKKSWERTVGRETRTSFKPLEGMEMFLFAPRMEARIREYLKGKHHNAAVVLLKPEQVAEMKIDPELVRSDIETAIPKLLSQAEGKNGVVVNVRTFEWNGEVFSHGRERAKNWKGVTVNIADTIEEKVYVELNRWHIKGQGINGVRSCGDLRDMKREVQGYVEWPETIYGVKTAILDQVAFRKGNWIKLSDWIKREMEAHKPKKVYVYKKGSESLIRKIATLLDNDECKEMLKIFDKIKKQETFANFCERAGLTLDKDYIADTMHADFFAQYPMLQFLSEYDVKPHLSEIKDYMNASH